MRLSAALRRHWAPLTTLALASALPLLVMQIWHARRGVPLTGYGGDGMLNLALVKDVLEHGWFQSNPSVAAPYGQELYDFSVFSGDNLNFALIKVLGLFSSDPSFVLNLFFLLTFPLTGLAAFFVLRRLGVSEEASIVSAVLFALLPYHFARGLSGHVFLGAYYSVPLGFYLATCVFTDEPLLTRRASVQGSRKYIGARSLATLGMAAVIATAGVYYAIFTLILIATAGLVAVVATTRTAPVLRAGGLIVLLCGLLVLNFSPNLVHRLAEGGNAAVGARLPVESETFATKLTHLVLPVPNHRVDALARITREYETSSVPAPAYYGVSLGTLASIGFGSLLVVLLAGGVRLATAGWRWRRLHEAATLALVTFLFVTVGGLSSLFAFEISPQIRGWYRLSIFLGFAAMLALGLLLDAIRDSPRLPTPVRRWFPAVLAVVLAVGVLDQTTADFVPPYRDVETRFRQDREFVDEIERRLPVGSEVFQLPYVPFPESVLHRMDAYDHARGYIHSDDLEWSWGSMQGRDEDWQSALADDPPPRVARSVAAAGFEGLWLDRWGYPDNGAATETQLRPLLGVPVLGSGDGRFAFFDLRPLRRRMEKESSAEAVERLARSTLEPG